MRKLKPTERMILEMTNLDKFDAYFCKKDGLFMSKKGVDKPNQCPYCKEEGALVDDAEQLQKDIKNGE